MKDSNLRFPRSKQGGIAASPMRDKNGGSSRIRTHGPFRAFSFQDCCLKPCSAILPLFGVGLRYEDRTRDSGITTRGFTTKLTSTYKNTLVS